MSSNDDSASRRGRRGEQGDRGWRSPAQQPRDDRWDQLPAGNRDTEAPHREQRSRDNPLPQAAYSNFTRPAYPPQPRQEQTPPPQPPQGYYQEPAPRQDFPRSYSEPHRQHEPQLPSYGGPARDDLFGREPAPPGYEQNPYPPQGGHQPDPYASAQARQPMMQPAAPRQEDADYYPREGQGEDYGRGLGARIAPQDAGGSRFYLPDEQTQARGGAAPATQDRGYAPAPSYTPGGYDPHGGAHETDEQDRLDPRFAPRENWPSEEQGFHAGDPRGAHPQHAAHGDEFDEDFFGDEEEYDQEDRPEQKKRGRKKLMAAALIAAIAAGGGAYYVKSMGGAGNKATPFIRADNRPPREVPGIPGGRQFPNGEKAIYERLTPDGQTQMASFAPPSAQAAPVFPAPASAGGNSLEDRIDEALKKARSTGDAPAAPPQTGRPGPDQPTVVRSESYRPDGTRVDSGRQVITPNITGVGNGLPYPFGNAAPSPMPGQAGAPFRTASAPAPAAPPQQVLAAAPPAPKGAPVRTAAAQAPAAAGGFYVSLKSAPDEKAIQRDVPALSDKYKSVLGEVQISSKIADLGAKGVTYRAVAGPLETRQEAMDLCTKIKGVGGDKACFVTN